MQMSYSKKIEYKFVLKDSFFVIHNCPKCGRKTHFKNTKKFRVNANGNNLDIWLIYQCENCRHTLNLAIYERQKVSSIPKEEYKCFLGNDEQLAERYGKDLQLFQKNKVCIDLEAVHYDFIKLREITEITDLEKRIVLTIQNPYKLKIRPEKQIAAILGLSRSQTKNFMVQEKIRLDNHSPQLITVSIDTNIYEENRTGKH